MNKTLKGVIAVILSLITLCVLYYGSYLPFKKSRAFISTLRELGAAKSFQEFTEKLSVPLDMPSPIGQEELVRNAGSAVLNIVIGNGANNPALVAAAVKYLEDYYSPIIESGSGMSFEQNLYILGLVNQVAFEHTRDPRYFDAAKRYYSQGLALGPRRPQFLYGIFDIYRVEGNLEKVRETANQILAQWPGDEKIRKFLEELEKGQGQNTE
ncbi:hypothetical protein C4571_01340 [Candidatus Parcubacteria bacterium]|nr:MAG: hypothetical protein C4571_01340 [Candidatus Parcubacteria bacterium]